MAKWRDLFDIHPAAELFPLMGEDDLKELAKDIEKRGLEVDPIFITGNDGRLTLVDGRNRLDAMERLGYEIDGDADDLHWVRGETRLPLGLARREAGATDPYELVLSLNVHRRHLTTAQKSKLIKDVLRAQPEKSNNAIAKAVKVDDKTVAARRKELEASSEIPKTEKRVDRKGRLRSASNPRARTTTEAHPEAQAPADASEAERASSSRAEDAAEPIAEISESSSREWVKALSNHLRRDPTGFLRDVAAIMAGQPELLAISERSRREAIAEITRALGLEPQPEVKPDKPRPRTTHFVRRS